MDRVLTCLSNEHDWRLVVLAAIVCLVASVVTVSLLHGARSAAERTRLAWLALAAAAAGSGIWATHFVAILAYRPGIPVAYDSVLIALSLAAAIAISFVGFAVAVMGRAWAANLIAGVIVGIGIAGMHYIGMHALELPGTVTWHGGLVLASIAVGILFGIAALIVAVRRTDIHGTILSGAMLALAIVSHHFTAMGAIQIAPDPNSTLSGPLLDGGGLAITVAVVAVAVLGMSLIAALADTFVTARFRRIDRDTERLIEESEQKLRQQNIRLDTALNNMSQGLCMFDANERVVVFNRRFLEMYRLSPEVVRPGCSLRELIEHRKGVGLLDADPQEYYEALRSDLARGNWRHWITQRHDGRVIEAQNQPMPGGGWVTTHEDITDRRRAEEQLREQKLILDAALNNMNQGLLMFDAQTRLVLCNQRYLQMYDLPPERVVFGSTTLHELLRLRAERGTFKYDPDRYVEELLGRLAEGKPVVLISELQDGRVISVSNRPMADGRWVSTHEDITEQQRAEQQLREQKLQLDTALNNMTQGLNMFDASGRLVVFNQRYLEMYRLSPDVVKAGCTVDDLVKARIAAGTFFKLDAQEYSANLLNSMSKRSPTSSIMETTDGRVIAVSSRPTPDGNGWVVTHEDITDRRRAEQERDRSRAFASTIIENVPATIIVKSARDLRYVLVNRAGEKYLGMRREDVIGKTSAEVFPPDIAKVIDSHDQQLLSTSEPLFVDEHPTKTPAGEARIVSTMRTPIRDQNGEVQFLLAVIEDRTHRKRVEAQVARLAHHDPLTGLPNRAAFNVCLNSTIETATKDNSSFALMCLDMDRFKEINDVFGQAVGDKVLCEIGRRLQEAVGGAFIARLGGDEFTVIATDGVQPAAAEALADSILAAVGRDFMIDGHQLRASLSIGVAIYPVDGHDATSLVANADAALYRAKSEGRSVYRFFEADMDKRLRDRRVLQQELQSAMERNELSLYYQPQARITGEVFGFEALVRWQHRTRGVVPPGTFIPLAEESGLIASLGEWVLREACRQAASWSNPLQIAINLSPIQFRHGDLPTLVHAILLETGLPASRLELEVTEGVLIGDFSRAVSILRRLKALGVRIAMDDFGTGYSSLSYLQSFPFDKIKIDQAFISNLERNVQSATIIRAVIGLARGLALPVLAEGVESQEQLAFLAREHCDEIQGFLVGRPLPIEDYVHLTGGTAGERARAAAG